MKDVMKLCDVIRETGYAIHRYHRNGHLEKVYVSRVVGQFEFHWRLLAEPSAR